MSEREPREKAGDVAIGRVRCFVAAFITAESAPRLQAMAREHLDPRLLTGRAGRSVPLENYHVTLKFLGEIAEPVMREAQDAVDALEGHRVHGEAIGLTGLPRPRSPRIVAATLAAQPALEAWWRTLQERLGAEERGFRPHVTLLRLRRPRFVRPVLLPDPVEVSLDPPRLYRSDQSAEGVRYRPLVLDDL